MRIERTSRDSQDDELEKAETRQYPAVLVGDRIDRRRPVGDVPGSRAARGDRDARFVAVNGDSSQKLYRPSQNSVEKDSAEEMNA